MRPPRPPGLSRARELRLNARLALSTAARHLSDDPLLLVLQTSRRLPRPLVGGASRALLLGTGKTDGDPVGSTRAAYGAWLAGHSARAGLELDAARRREARRTPWGRRLMDELSVQLGQTVVLPAGPSRTATSLRARAAWQRGDIEAALQHASGNTRHPALHDRFASEAAMMQVGMRVEVVGTPRFSAREPGAEISAFHVLTNSLPHTQSGYTMRSHSVLTAQRDAGIRVAAATRLGYPVSVGKLLARQVDQVNGITYTRLLPSRVARLPEARLREQVELLLPVVEAFAPQVLHTTTPYSNALVTQSLATQLGLPWVYEVRGLLEETWVASRPAGTEREHAAQCERHRLLRARETELARAADHIVTLSETLRQELVERGVDASRITVIPNAVDARLLERSSSPAQARAALGLPVDGFWVGTVSSLVDYEGLDTLIDAIAKLRQRGIDARGLLVGGGTSRPELESRATNAAIRDSVIFTGRVPHECAADYHEALDVFVVPRRNVRVARRVTPLKPIEAMACGRPVVASDLPALAEIVAVPGSGLLAPAGDAEAWADALQMVAEQPDLAFALGKAGRQFASGRTWQHAGDAYRTLYEQVVAR